MSTRIDTALQDHETLIVALLRPEVYPHPVERVERIETHISSILLAGGYAYKIKKPLNPGFLDFSTLERRAFFCREELRLNRRLAPRLYQSVVTITGTPEQPRIDGQGPVIEYAVRMIRFDQDQRLDRLLARAALPPGRIDELARCTAEFHAEIEVAPPDSPHGEPISVFEPMQQNFDQLRTLLTGHDTRLDRLADWTRRRYAELTPLLIERKRSGFIRECHGDLHLGNIAIIDGAVTLFDGIEFNESLRWIDIISDVAFLTMDLCDHGALAHAGRYLNAWLERSGDYPGLGLLPFYQVYRAMVRAKVATLRLGQSDLVPRERDAVLAQCHGYLDLAERFSRPGRPALFINHGFSGSGKTTLSQPLLEAIGAVRIRSDVERKRLAGIGPLERHDDGLDSGLYAPDSTARTYARLAELAEGLLVAGYPVIVDATFLKAARRGVFASLARRRGVPFRILDYRIDVERLKARIDRRLAAGDDASDADLAVVERQLATHDPLLPEEPVIGIDPDALLPLESIRQAMAARP